MIPIRDGRLFPALIAAIAVANCGGGGTQGDGAVCKYFASGPLVMPPSFDFSVTFPDDSALSCSTRISVDGGSGGPFWPAPVTSVISGWVTAVGDTELSVDTCQAGGGCSAAVYRFTIEAPGLRFTVPVGRQVTVGWWLYSGMSCGRALVISDGVATGTGTVAPLWLAGADSLVSPQLALPFSVARQELFCNPNPSLTQGCGGNDVPPDDYAFQFTPQSGNPSVSVATGQTATLTLTVGAGTPQHLSVRSLRSYQTLMCDDYANWAWWAMGQASPSGAPE